MAATTTTSWPLAALVAVVALCFCALACGDARPDYVSLSEEFESRAPRADASGPSKPGDAKPTASSAEDIVYVSEIDYRTVRITDAEIASGACDLGVAQECRVYFPSHEGVTNCFVGVQLCEPDGWSGCMTEDQLEQLLH